MVGLAHQSVEELGKLGNPLDVADAGRFAGGVLGEFAALPRGDQVGGFAKEQNLPQSLVVGIGIEQEDRFLLFHAGKEEQVGVGHGTQRAVGIGGEEIVGIDHREGARREKAGKTSAVLGKDPGIDRRVAHGNRVRESAPRRNPEMTGFIFPEFPPCFPFPMLGAGK